MLIITLFISVLIASVGAVELCNRCDQIPLGKANYQEWMTFSPYFIYRATTGAFNCSTIQYVGPIGTDTSYSGSCFIINGNVTINHDATLTDSILSARQCSDGTLYAFRVMFSNLYSTGNASVCVFICDSQGVHISTLTCWGRTPVDEAYIQNYLNTQLKVPITGPVYHSQSNCPKTKYCVGRT